MTLVELIVVLSIISIIASLSFVPATKSFVIDVSLSSAIKKLKSDLMEVRFLALQSNLLHKAVFDIGQQNLVIYEAHSTQNIWIEKETINFENSQITFQGSSLADNQVIFDFNAIPYEDGPADLPQQSTDLPLNEVESVTIDYNGEATQSIFIVPETGIITRFQN